MDSSVWLQLTPLPTLLQSSEPPVKLDGRCRNFCRKTRSRLLGHRGLRQINRKGFLRTDAFLIGEGQHNEVEEGSPRRLAEMIKGAREVGKGGRKAVWGLDKSSPARWMEQEEA